ncbi:GNAT family N-acetyltransferase [Mumia sp. DW29H23]|uniref:GNAT family N-acetyltransferase n=1 Tax=Mumia sp. DW29H23 TaxID=3421241 RepID=UPI003D694E59
MPDLVQPSLPRGTLSDRPQPTLSADELVLRPWRPGDAEALVAAYEDADVQRWHVRSLTAAEAAQWITATVQQWSSEAGGQWAVVDHGGALLGRVAFSDVDLVDGYAEIGYWTVAEARGRGVATRAVRAVGSWLLDDVGFHRLEIEHAIANAASCRVAVKAGFALEGTRRSAARHADGWHDMHLHARLADDRALS